jgi:hypothetical protein
MTDQENLLLEKLSEKLDKLDHKTDRIYYGLYGIPDTDDNGMCGEFKDLKEDYYKFKQKAITVFFYLLGSGVLGVGIWQLIKLG